MPRKAHIVKREIVPDPMYQSTLISKFVNCMMYGGKKSTAQHILYGAHGHHSEEDPGRSAEAFQEGCRERQARSGSEIPPRRRFDLSGAGRSQSGPANIAEHSLDSDCIRAAAARSPWKKSSLAN